MANKRMNINRNGSTPKKQKTSAKSGGGSFKGISGPNMKGVGNATVKYFAGGLLLLAILGGLFGWYNQKETLINLKDHILNIGKKIGETITDTVKDGKNPVDDKVQITDDGVYLNGVEPPKEGLVDKPQE